MAQTSFALMTSLGRAREAAALADAGTIEITHIAIGDGATVPSGGETALYNEVDRKTISAHGTVVGASNVAYFDAFLAADDGPYTIREAGLYDSEGDLIAIAHYDPPISKPVPASGQTVEGTVRLEVAFSDVANVTIRVDPAMKVALQRLTRLPWVPVVSMALAAPPAAPAVGDTYVVAAGATGAWAGQAGKLAEYTVAGWAIVDPPNGHGVSLPDGRVFVRLAGAYAELLASETVAGLVRLATEEEARSATGDDAVPARHLSHYLRQPSDDQVFWIRPDGSNANDGGANTAARAFLTVGGALGHIRGRYGSSGRRIVLQLGTPGNYGSFQIQDVAAGLLLRGDIANRASYVFGGGNTINGANVTLEGITIHPAGAATSHNLQVYGSAAAVMDHVRMAGAVPLGGWSQLIIASGASVTVKAGAEALSFHQGALAAVYAQAAASFHLSGGSGIQFVGSPEFTLAVMYAHMVASMSLWGSTLSGAPIGKRFQASMNSVISTSGGGPNYIPGTIAGTTASGGQYA